MKNARLKRKTSLVFSSQRPLLKRCQNSSEAAYVGRARAVKEPEQKGEDPHTLDKNCENSFLSWLLFHFWCFYLQNFCNVHLLFSIFTPPIPPSDPTSFHSTLFQCASKKRNTLFLSNVVFSSEIHYSLFESIFTQGVNATLSPWHLLSGHP